MSEPFKKPVEGRPVARQNILPIQGGVSNGIYVPSDSALNVRARLYGVASVILNVKGYVLRSDTHEIRWFGSQNTFVLQNGGLEQVFIIPLPEGILLSCDVSVPSTSAIRGGQLYATINLQQGVEAVPESPLFATVAAGYVFQGRGLSFPYGDYTNHQDDTQGWCTVVGGGAIIGPDPAGETIYTVPDYTKFELKALTMQIDCGAGAGNLFLLEIIPPVGIGMQLLMNTSVAAAGAVIQVNMADGLQSSQVLAGAVYYDTKPLPTLTLQAGTQLSVLSFAAVDPLDYQGIEIWGRYWLEPFNSVGGGGGQGGGAQ